jgi:hypothetical protein
MTTSSISNTTLHGSVLALARIAWGAGTLFCIAYYIFWALYSTSQPLLTCTVQEGICNPFYLGIEDVAVVRDSPFPFEWWARSFYGFNVLASLVFIIVGLVIVWRKSNDWMALLISLILIALGAVGITPSTNEVIPLGTPLYAFVTLFAFLGYFGPFTALFYFPDGQFVPRWSRWFCFALVASTFTFFGVSNYLVADSVFWVGFTILMGGCTLVGVGSMVYRYRQVATVLQRQQIKWVALGLLAPSLSVIMWLLAAVFLPPEHPNPTRTVIIAITFPFVVFLNALFPVTVALAMVRYRLWDIDVLIRRTVTYTLVTGMLVTIFFVSVVVLQQLLASIIGTGQNELVTVLSTLAIAALFVPLRNWVQNEIRRRFNRKKYDPQQVLNDFAVTVRDETDLEKLTARLMQVVDDTMQPKSVSVWLNDPATKYERVTKEE